MTLGADGFREIPAVCQSVAGSCGWRDRIVRDQLRFGPVLPQDQSQSPEVPGSKLGLQARFGPNVAEKGQDGSEVVVAKPAEGVGRHAEHAAAIRADAVANDTGQLCIAPSGGCVRQIRRDKAGDLRIIEEDLALEANPVTTAKTT